MLRLFKDPRVDFFRDDFFGPSFLNQPMFRKSEVKQNEDGTYVIALSALGFHKDELTIETENDVLIVNGEIKRELPNFISSKKINRSWELTNLDAKSVDAVLEDGILTLTFGVKETSKSKKNTIKVK